MSCYGSVGGVVWLRSKLEEANGSIAELQVRISFRKERLCSDYLAHTTIASRVL